MKIYDFEQGSQEWHQSRCGIPTASVMKKLFTAKHAIPKGITGQVLNYAAQLAGDKQSGLPLSVEEGFQGNWATERGHELEGTAAMEYALETGTNVQAVGFITSIESLTGSDFVDRLVGDDGLLEIKCLLATAHTIAVAEASDGTCPADYYIQCQAQMWITGRQWCDLKLYHPHLPSKTVRVNADAGFQKLLQQQVDLVLTERDRLVGALEAA